MRRNPKRIIPKLEFFRGSSRKIMKIEKQKRGIKLTYGKRDGGKGQFFIPRKALSFVIKNLVNIQKEFEVEEIIEG